MPKSSLTQIVSLLAKASGRAIRLGIVGAASGASTGAIGGAMIANLSHLTAHQGIQQGVLASSVGGAVIGGGIGFVQGALFQLSPQFARSTRDFAHDDDGMKLLTLLLLIMYLGKEMSGAVLGNHLISEDGYISDGNAVFYGSIGGLSTFCGMYLLTMITFFATGCVNENTAVNILDYIVETYEYLLGLPSAAEIEEVNSQREENNRVGQP